VASKGCVLSRVLEDDPNEAVQQALLAFFPKVRCGPQEPLNTGHDTSGSVKWDIVCIKPMNI
jgi:hypothetical protein